MLIGRVVRLVARDLDLLESPLRQDGVRGAKVAARVKMPEPHPRRQRVDPIHLAPRSPQQIVDDLDDPIIVRVPDRRVPVRADLVVELGDGSGDAVRVEVPAGRRVDDAHLVAVL